MQDTLRRISRFGVIYYGIHLNECECSTINFVLGNVADIKCYIRYLVDQWTAIERGSNSDDGTENAE